MEGITVFIDGKELQAKLVEVVYHPTEERQAEVTVMLDEKCERRMLAPLTGKTYTEKETIEDLAERLYQKSFDTED